MIRRICGFTLKEASAELGDVGLDDQMRLIG